MKPKSLDDKIREIVTYHSDGGTSGYLLGDGRIDQLKQLFKKEMMEIVGSDEVDTYQDMKFNDYRAHRNELRKELRTKVKEEFELR